MFRKTIYTVIITAVLVAAAAVGGVAQEIKSKDDAIGQISKLVATKKPEDVEKAYQIGVKLLAKFGQDKDERIPKVKKFVDGYRESQFFKLADARNSAEAILVGKEILAAYPEHMDVLPYMAYCSYDVTSKTKNKALGTEAIALAKKSIELIDAGKVPQSYAPFKDKNESEGYMYFIIGFLSMETDKREGAVNMYKSISIESPLKNDYLPYYIIATFYEGEYERLSADLKTKQTAKAPAAEIAALSTKTTQTINQMLDAYARTCKRADMKNDPNKEVYKQRYNQIYKFVKTTDAGAAEFINVVDLSAMPDPGKN